MTGAGVPCALPPGGLSLISDYGEHGSSCCYCGSKRHTSVSHGMMAESLSVEAYQELIDRGWRRSGRWVYFPLQERSCCQLLTIRLDVTRFQPNKEQRRTLRRWQAYLEGAPLRSEQQEQQQQQHAATGAGGQHAGAAAPGSPRAPAGGSPKRPHDDIAADAAQWGQPPADRQEQQRQGQQQQGGAEEDKERPKRSRRVAATGCEEGQGAACEAQRPPRGSSPASRLSEQLQQALRSSSLPLGGEEGLLQADAAGAGAPAAQQESQQARQQGLPSSGGEASLAAALAAALQQALAAGRLPAAAYPAPRVQQPSAKQAKVLPAGVTHTSPFPLAVAAAASKALAASGAGGPAKASAEEVAALLVQQLPAELAAACQPLKGHLNFCLPHAAAEGGGQQAAQHGQQQQEQRKQDRQHRQQQQAAQGSSQPSNPAAAAAAATVAAGGGDGGIPRGMPRHFELRTLPSSDPSIVQVEFQLFKKYQVVHHGDKPGEVNPPSFKRFLVDSPLPHVGPERYPSGGCPPTGFGSFHQQYWLDGRLVAVGVVDVLPRCLSSKYLFWDPDMAPLSLGKLTSLREIEWVQEAQRACPSLRYYYLGFYIHSCHRMRYKGDFAPADLLCPKHKCWVPLSRVQAALEQPGMIPISELPGALEGLGAEHGVDPASGRPTTTPHQPSTEELDACRLLIRLPPALGGGRQARAVTLGQLRQLGMLQPSNETSLTDPLGKWWSRAGPAAAALTAYAID
ncbi:hypothetical protein ABPG75_007098 [Micractinium tetrahymenae]